MNWMYSCKQVARLLSQRLDEPLGMFERIRLSVHLSMCDDCRHVAQQLDCGTRAYDQAAGWDGRQVRLRQRFLDGVELLPWERSAILVTLG